jgi:hypothetical protein
MAGNCISLIQESKRFADMSLTPKRTFDDIVLSTDGKTFGQL